MTPTMTSRIAVPRVSAASFWKRVNGSPARPDGGARTGRGCGECEATRILARHRSSRSPAAAHRRPRLAPRRPRAASATLPAMTPRSLLAVVAALVLVVAACSPGASGTTVRRLRRRPVPRQRACPTTPAPQGTPEGWDVAAQTPSVFPQIINPSGTIACGPTRLMFSFLDAQNVPVGAPDRTVEVALFDLGADPATARPDAAPRRSSGRSSRPSASTSSMPTSRRPASGARSSRRPSATPRPRPSASASTSSPTSAVVAVGDPAPSVGHADARRRRRRRDEDLDRRRAGRRLLRDVHRRCAGREEAVRRGLRDAEVLQDRAVRSDARPGQADRRRPPGGDLHQRRAVPARRSSTDSSSRS